MIVWNNPISDVPIAYTEYDLPITRIYHKWSVSQKVTFHIRIVYYN